MGQSQANRRPTMWSRVAVVLLSTASCHAGLLGAGTGEGSCAAAPFRALAVKWPLGCPASAPCCSEYGYCQPEAWHAGAFRDCNGVSNGRPLAPEAIAAENEAIAHGDASAANLLVVPAGGSVAGAAAPVAVAPAPAPVAVAPAAPVAVAAGNPYAAAAPVATYAPGINHYATPYAGYAGAVYAANGYAANGAYTGYAAAPAAAYAAAPSAAYAAHAVPAAAYAGQHY